MAKATAIDKEIDRIDREVERLLYTKNTLTLLKEKRTRKAASTTPRKRKGSAPAEGGLL